MNLDIASAVERRLVQVGWSPAELGRRSGVPKQTISSLLNGLADWLPHHVAAVAEALGVAPRDLLPGPDDAPGQVDDGPPRSNPAGPELTAAEAELLEAVRGGDAARLAQALAAAVGAARNDDRTSAPVTRAEVVRLTRQRPKQPKK